MVIHPIKPIYNENSKILILGSFPSVKSREQGFFYGHAKNRFWQVLAKLKNEKIPYTIQEKTEFLIRNNIAVWDVISSCEIRGSADSSIKNVVPNNLEIILENSKVKTIFLNGKTAEKYYNKYLKNNYLIKVITLPSTSPANAKFSLDMLVNEWSKILDD